MKLRKIAGSILFLIGLIALWQFLYTAATTGKALCGPESERSTRKCGHAA